MTAGMYRSNCFILGLSIPALGTVKEVDLPATYAKETKIMLRQTG